MNPSRFYFLAVAIIGLATTSYAVPNLIQYQGQVAVNGTPFDGTGLFRFALINPGGDTTYWSNDGTSTNGAEPTTAVSLTVNNGIYSLTLGDTGLANMSALPASVFQENSEVYLRIWFDDNDVATAHGSEQLGPDQRIAAVGFAIMAGQAATVADGAVTEPMLADGSITSGKLADGAVTTSKISPTYYVGESSPSDLDLTGTPGQATYPVTFDRPFAAGTTPDIALPEGWSLSGSASETGFTASRVYAPQVVDATGNPDQFNTSLATVNGNPAVSYWSAADNHLKYARATDADGATWGAPVTVDSSPKVGRYSSLAVVDGRPAISYWDNTNHNLKYVIANDANGTSWGTPVEVHVGGSVGEYTSLAVVNGNPAISYHDNTNDELKYVRANDATGSTWGSRITVDTDGNEGRFTSLKVVNGFPAISYYDVSNIDLKYARANDADGTSWGTPVTVDFAGDVGTPTSMEIVDGRPAIAYWDFTNS